jgi:hypothetical protein
MLALQLLHAGKRIQVAAKLVGSAENDASCFERVHNEVSWLASRCSCVRVHKLIHAGVSNICVTVRLQHHRHCDRFVKNAVPL